MPRRAKRRTRVFYAYPSQPPAIGETIEAAVGQLATSSDLSSANVRIRTWPDMKVGGVHLLHEITDNIDSAHIFACDLTYRNLNVAFELGYALAQFKRIYPTVNTSISDSTIHFRQSFYAFLGVGYAGYVNHDELVKQLIWDEPWESPDASLIPASFNQAAQLPENPGIYYGYPPTRTDAVIRTEEAISESRFGPYSLFDNPLDNPTPSCQWLFDQMRAIDGVVVHLLSDEHARNEEHNLRASLAAGIAHGLSKPLLMLAHSPFEPPMDYDNLLQVHETASETEQAIGSWIANLDENVPQRRRRRSLPVGHSPLSLDLRHLNPGQSVAEHEHRVLDEHFVELDVFFKALGSETTVIVGRRGTGKTATLYALRNHYGADSRNHVSIIKPIGYEVDGLVRILRTLRDRSERGYLIESLWKYLIYTELAGSLHAELSARPLFIDSTEGEASFIEYWAANKDILDAPFSERLDRTIDSLTSESFDSSAIDNRDRISELLHSERIGLLRRQLGVALTDRNVDGYIVFLFRPTNRSCP